MIWKVYVLAVAYLVLRCAGAANAAMQLQYKDLGTLGGNSSEGFAIDNLGRVTGASNLPGEPSYTGFRHAFLNDGSMHNLGTLGGNFSLAHGLNDIGVIVGESYSADGGPHAFFYDGEMNDLHNLAGLGPYTSTVATAINNVGQIIGYMSFGGTFQHAFLYDGAMHDLNPSDPSGISSQAVAINNLGDVLSNGTIGPQLCRPGIGCTYLANVIDPLAEWQGFNANGINDSGMIVGSGRHGGQFVNAYIYDGTMRDLGRLDGSVASMLFDVNSRGDAVGYAVTYGENVFGTTVIYTPLFYSQETGLVNLNTLVPGFAIAQALAINDAGQITGTSYSGHAFLLTPLPEPSSIATIVIGLIALSTRRVSQHCV